MNFLYEDIATLLKYSERLEIPSYITQGLSAHIELRPYQREALEYTLTCLKNNMQGNAQTHLLYHMATGAGKTVMMAALILYYYREGYRNFLFFVNQKNIVEKTRDNFLNAKSRKYLFNNKDDEYIRIDGRNVKVTEVSDFSEKSEDICIAFMTTSTLHNALKLFGARENGLSIDSFSRRKVVLISDEAHHINVTTKKMTKAERENDESWEMSVMRAFHANTKNVLLEFTATCDLKNPNVEEKYRDKIVYDYPLAKFRESGYTKDFLNVRTDYGRWERTLLALILSEYRRALFAELHQDAKPVVLLKSRQLPDSKAFYAEFQENLQKLTKEELLSLNPENNEWFNMARAYFLRQDPSLRTLVKTLQEQFSAEHAMLLDSENLSIEKQLAVNSLEDADNPYRIIFTVGMLDEGWDVLNLFDIVRLYETRQSGGKGSAPYTIREAQLIGRGARYCPFVTDDEDERFRRKFDRDMKNPYRLLETLLFHSVDDSRYIEELKKALRETGLLDTEEMIELTYRLKDSFKATDAFRRGYVFTNERRKASRAEIRSLDDKLRFMDKTYRVPEGRGGLSVLFGENDEADSGKRTKETHTHMRYLKEIPYGILSHAAEAEPAFYFDMLRSRFPNLNSLREFLTSGDYCGNIKVHVENHSETATAKQWLAAVRLALREVNDFLLNMKENYIGTKEFREKPLRDILRDKTIRVAKERGSDGHGYSQSDYQSLYSVNLKQANWYVFNDNYGTDEEKGLVKYIHEELSNLEKLYDEIYLIRNEQFKELSIYNFDDGQKFEPDFILMLRKNHSDAYEVRQVFIEPKGPQLVAKDKWKEDFLLRLKEEARPVSRYVLEGKYSITGLPFYNKEEKKQEFEKAFAEEIETGQYGK